MSDLYLLLTNFVNLFLESAPWLLLGLLVAGIMHELVPISLLQKHMGNNSVAAIGKAAVIGAPLPLCSCGVIPAAVGLRRSGASKPATVSFLVSTPETGVDSVSVSYALLGPFFAIIRPIAAVVSAIYTGLMVKWFDSESPVNTPSTPTSTSCCSAPAVSEPVKQSSCCSTSDNTAKDKNNAAVEGDACCSETTTSPAKPSIFAKVVKTLQFASGKLLNDIAVWLLIGLFLAACIQTWVPTNFLTQWGDGLLAMIVMAVIGIPMYICATASTPIAVGFLSAGLSPGAVLVFLLAGPATNISTMGMIAKELGNKALGLYLFSVISASIGFGYGINFLISKLSLQQYIVVGQSIHEHGANTQAIYALCAVVLFSLMMRNGWQALQTKLSKQTASSCCH